MTSAHPLLSLNQATVRYASLPEVIAAAERAGIRSVGIWRSAIEKTGASDARRRLADAGLAVTGLCHSAPLCELDAARRLRSHSENLRAIDEAAELARDAAASARPVLTLVAGGLPTHSRDLAGARERARDAVGELVPIARAAGVTLGIEPFHPLLAADRSVIATLAQALDVAEQFDAGTVGVIVDSWHVWWDPMLEPLLLRAGERIVGVQVADWLPATPQLRGQPGAGIIDFGALLGYIAAAGYTGAVEVEIFNPEVWSAPIDETVAATVAAFDAHIAPALSRP